MKRNLKKGWGALSLLSIVTLSACGSSIENPDGYTYNTYISTSPSTWNVHTWETSDESYVSSFTEMGLYDCILNSTKDGYEFVTEMAAEMPIAIDPNDLTDEEYDTYYSAAGNPGENMIWDIKLNRAACFEDGSVINADTYVDSMELQLSPRYANYRADSYYNGNLILVNAENYYKQNRQTLEPVYGNIDSSGYIVDDTGTYYFNLGANSPYVLTCFSNADDSTSLYDVLDQYKDNYSDIKEACERIIGAYQYYLWKGVDHTGSSNKEDWDKVDSLDDVSSTLIEEYGTLDAGYLDTYVFDSGFTNLFTNTQDVIKTVDHDKLAQNAGVADYNQYVEENLMAYTQSEFQDDLQAAVARIGNSRGDFAKSWSWKLPLFTYLTLYTEDVEFSEVGIRKMDDYTIRLYLTKSITPLNLKFSLTGNWIVNVNLYRQLTTELSTGYLATTYASNATGNYLAYGPYKLTKFEAGKEITLERNERWYGYSDGNHEGQFQMDKLYTRVITEHATAMSEFLAGNLDDIDLTVNDVREYGSSGRATTTYESYTQKVSFNTNRARLLSRQSGNNNKTIIANEDFRKGLSLGINRTQFASQATSGSKAFTGLLNDLYLANNSTGQAYRTTEQGQSVYNAIYGTLGGSTIYDPEGTAEPVALAQSAEGYNGALAIEYVKKAILEETTSDQDGHLNKGDTIEIEFRVYDNKAENTIAAIDYLTSTWSTLINDAVAAIRADSANNWTANDTIGFNLNVVVDQDYYDSASNGNYDMIFSIWGGAAINPYGLMQVYCDSTFDNCCEYGFKGHQDEVMLDIDVDGNGTIDAATETKSFDAWYQAVNNNGEGYNEAAYGDELSPGDENYEEWLVVHNRRLAVLAGLEAGIVNRFEAIPLVARGSTSLLSFKVENATQNYISLIGYGGIRFMTFNYNNQGWADFCSQNGNALGNLYKAAES